jgi:hypothetical protein
MIEQETSNDVIVRAEIAIEIARAIVTACIYELEAQDPAGAKDLPSFAGNFSICSKRIRVGDRDRVENVIALWGHEEGARLSHVHEIIQAASIRPGVKVGTLPARAALASGDSGGASLVGRPDVYRRFMQRCPSLDLRCKLNETRPPGQAPTRLRHRSCPRKSRDLPPEAFGSREKCRNPLLKPGRTGHCRLDL